MAYDKKNRNPKASETARKTEYTAKQLAERRANRGHGSIADWGNADPVKLSSAVEAVTGKGWTIQFGYSSDGGSLSVVLYDWHDRTTDYIRATEDVDLYLEQIVSDFGK